MYCCGQCTLDTETTITAVVLIQPHPEPRAQKLKQLIEKGLTTQEKYKYQELLNINKENRQPNQQIASARRTRRKASIPHNVTQSFLIQDDGAQTGRFNGPPCALDASCINESRTKRNGESSLKRNCQSKTTSFGSRKSSAAFFRERQLEMLHDELKKLREEELRLQKEKLEKEYIYQKELSRVYATRDQLRVSSGQRKADIIQLRQLIRKHKQSLHGLE